MTVQRLLALTVAVPLLGCSSPSAGPAPSRCAAAAVLQPLADSARDAGKFPGLTLGVAMTDGGACAVASGFADTSARIPLTPASRMLQGSVGKTYVAAVAMQLVQEGKLELDAKIAKYLGNRPWFNRLPNAADITVRELMNHTSGLVRYEFDPRATAIFRSQPMKVWTPEERLAFLFDTRADFAAGQGWDYSDTNYIVLGMIIEQLTGHSYYAELERRILKPLKFANTIPSDRPELPGVANGYAGPHNELGGYDASIVNRKMAVNPQLEWTGGGVASTADDLARWGFLLYTGKAFDPQLLPQVLDGVPAKLGPNTRYGLGVILRDTPLGPAYGHSGFFPGYATEMLYLPNLKIALAVQVNITDPYPRGMVSLLLSAARHLQTAGLTQPPSSN